MTVFMGIATQPKPKLFYYSSKCRAYNFLTKEHKNITDNFPWNNYFSVKVISDY